MNILTTAGLIIIGILLFELIIFVHEGGHFLLAKLSGVKVNEFALGMGPKLFSFTIKETTYSLRLFPIGGYCAMEGEDEESDNPRAFNNVKVYKRLLIVIAGAVMNILLGLVFMLILLAPSKTFATTTISSFSPEAYSANSGLKAGDTIVSIDGYAVSNSIDLSYSIATLKVSEVDGDSFQIYKQDCTNALYDVYVDFVTGDKLNDAPQSVYDGIFAKLSQATQKVNSAQTKAEADSALSDGYALMYSDFPDEKYTVPKITAKDTRPRFRTDIDVMRDGERVTLHDVDFLTVTEKDKTEPSIRMDFYVEPLENNFINLVAQTGSQTFSIVRMVYDTLAGLVSGQFGFTDISGPIGVASATVQVAQQGLKSGFGDAVRNILYVMMIITVNLGVVNMLPFPALDGGRFLFLLIEGVTKRHIPRKAEQIVNGLGLGLLLLLMVVIAVKDVWQLIVR